MLKIKEKMESIIKVSRSMDGIFFRRFSHLDKENDLNFNHMKTLLILNFEGSSPMSKLSEILQLEKGSFTSVAKRLIEEEYIEKIRDENDKRVYMLQLTDYGKKTVIHFQKRHLEYIDSCINILDEDEQELYFTLMKQMNVLNQKIANGLKMKNRKEGKKIMDYQKTLDHVVDIVKVVGKFQLDAKKKQDFNISTKGDNINFVTDIDRKSEEMIISKIREFYPEHSILAEETGMTDKESDYKWVIDPIDGTTNYIHGFPLHCISIGLKYKEETMLGVVDIPTVSMRFTAIRGEGSYLNGEEIHVSDINNLGNSVIATGFPYFRKENNVNLPYFNKIVNDIAGIRRTGSAAVDLSFVASGMLDGFWEFALNEWDICAGLLLIEEAGGKITEIKQQGHPLLICGNQAIHDQLLDYIIL